METAKQWLTWAVDKDNQVLLGAVATVLGALAFKFYMAYARAREGLQHTTSAIEAGPGMDQNLNESIMKNLDLKPETVKLLMDWFTNAVKNKVFQSSAKGSEGAANIINKVLVDNGYRDPKKDEKK